VFSVQSLATSVEVSALPVRLNESQYVGVIVSKFDSYGRATCGTARSDFGLQYEARLAIAESCHPMSKVMTVDVGWKCGDSDRMWLHAKLR
jgi:hypothetical protein